MSDKPISDYTDALEARIAELEARLSRLLLDAASANGDAAKAVAEVARLEGRIKALVCTTHLTEGDCGDNCVLCENERLRGLVWFSHGHGPDLYGDDGEMRCNRCLADFKRMSPDELTAALTPPPAEPKDCCKRASVTIGGKCVKCRWDAAGDADE